MLDWQSTRWETALLVFVPPADDKPHRRGGGDGSKWLASYRSLPSMLPPLLQSRGELSPSSFSSLPAPSSPNRSTFLSSPTICAAGSPPPLARALGAAVDVGCSPSIFTTPPRNGTVGSKGLGVVKVLDDHSWVWGVFDFGRPTISLSHGHRVPVPTVSNGVKETRCVGGCALHNRGVWMRVWLYVCEFVCVCLHERLFLFFSFLPFLLVHMFQNLEKQSGWTVRRFARVQSSLKFLGEISVSGSECAWMKCLCFDY